MKPVVIVGAGALGSHVVLLARNWKHPLVVIDFDRVEQRNVESQFHTRMTLRKSKVLSLQQSMQGLFGTTIQVNPRELGPDNVDALLNDARLVIDCTDNLKARQTIQNHCRLLRIPCLHGALSAAGDFGLAVWTEDFVPDSEAGTTGHTCENGMQLPFFALAAAQVALVAQEFLITDRKQSFQFTAHSVLRIG